MTKRATVTGCGDCPLNSDDHVCNHPDGYDSTGNRRIVYTIGDPRPAWCPLVKAPLLVELDPSLSK